MRAKEIESAVAVERKRPDLAKIPVLHTQVVDESILEMIRLRRLRTLELDLSRGVDGELYIGHHRLFYQNKKENFPPNNIPVEKAMETVIEYGVFLKFDCKDREAMPGILQLIKKYKLGSGKFMLHAYVTEFDFQEEARDSYWQFEDIFLAEFTKMRDAAAGPALQVSCRGFIFEKIKDRDSEQVEQLFEVCSQAQANGVEVVNLGLPDNRIPPDWILKYFHERGILIEVYKAKIDRHKLPCAVFVTTEIDKSNDTRI